MQHAHNIHSYRPSNFALFLGDCNLSLAGIGLLFCKNGFALPVRALLSSVNNDG